MENVQKRLDAFLDAVHQYAAQHNISYQISCGQRYGENNNKILVCEMLHEETPGDCYHCIEALVQPQNPVFAMIAHATGKQLKENIALFDRPVS